VARNATLPSRVFSCWRIRAIATASRFDQAFPVDDGQARPRVVDQVAKAQFVRRNRHVASSRRNCRG